MRFDSSLILIGSLAVLAVFAIAVGSSYSNGGNQKVAVSLLPDKEVYHSGEVMNLSVEVSGEVGNATLSIRGVKDSRGSYRVQQDYLLPALSRRVNFAFVMPSCYGCAGISPGDYEISVRLVSNGEEIANSTRVIKLER